ncbi:unnamed protein product, partial [Candidula unifasciata]
SDSRRKFVKIAKHLREDVVKKLQDRNKREMHMFKDFEQAVKRSTWVKKVNMQMYLYGRKSRWIPCSVELEQGITNLSEGSLTVHYQQKRKQKNIQILLSEMICVKPSSDPDNACGFVVYTPATNMVYQPLMLKAASENEAIDWMGCLSAANAAAWGMNCSATPGAIWSCTFSGDVFISPASSACKSPSELCWGQHGGHMRLVETGPSGVTWALGFDKMPYVYNGGYGGAFSTGMSDMSENTQQIVDHHRVFVYENQKWFPVVGWCCKGVFQHDFHWLTEFGRSVEVKEEIKLPSSKCQWISEWTVDFSTPGGVDAHGWQYSSNLYGPFYPRQHLRSSYRRRRWVRHYKITVFGPWQAAGSLGLVDLSIQVDPLNSILDPVVLWAVGGNGDVLCRYGVTASNPKGQSWIHVATDLDKPFKSISVGGSYRVWGIAGDGSAWFRPGVGPYNHTGTCWLQVVPPPPGNFLLHQVSVGATSVWAVDTGDNLWRRENITPTFPEGTGWELVAGQVKRVSVGLRDQVWIIADAYFCKMKHGAGVIYRRVGITGAKPSGTDWEVVIGSGWSHVSVRGVSEVKQDDSLSVTEDENS